TRKFIDQLRHSIIVFDAMQPHPRKQQFAGGKIFVIGLVLVPDNGQRNRHVIYPNKRTEVKGLIFIIFPNSMESIPSSANRSFRPAAPATGRSRMIDPEPRRR